ncbi:MAG: hypothetical protein ACFFHD_08050 [Promethearchaeota archaeon]
MKKNSILWSFVVTAILIIFIFNQMLAILSTLTLLGIVVFYYILSLTFKKEVIRFMSKHDRVIDTDIAKKLNYPIQKLREKLNKFHKRQKRCGLIVFLNNKYIFYSNEAIKEFKNLYINGLKEKEIFKNLKGTIDLKTRAEIKAIRDTLINQNIIEEKDIKVNLKY